VEDRAASYRLDLVAHRPLIRCGQGVRIKSGFISLANDGLVPGDALEGESLPAPRNTANGERAAAEFITPASEAVPGPPLEATDEDEIDAGPRDTLRALGHIE
jgi:hypothetical protein